MLKHLEGFPQPVKRVFKGTMIFLLIVLSVFIIFKTRNVIREYGYIGRAPLSQYTVTISGEGEVSTVPDIARVDLGVTSEAKTVKQAQSDNTSKMNAIISAVKEMGVDEKDLKTANYSIYPKYSYDRNSGISTIIGYTVSQSVDVKIRSLDKIGDIIAKAGELGANQVGGVDFTVDKPESLKAEARELAIKNAKEKADALFKELGVTRGRIVSFSESDAGGPVLYKSMETYGIGGGAPSPDIEAGSLDIVSYVSITFEIK